MFKHWKVYSYLFKEWYRLYFICDLQVLLLFRNGMLLFLHRISEYEGKCI
jgi:hypothetical protein